VGSASIYVPVVVELFGNRRVRQQPDEGRLVILHEHEANPGSLPRVSEKADPLAILDDQEGLLKKVNIRLA